MTQETLTLDELMSRSKDFRSTAYYDKHLDAIRVQVADCSIWEERKNRFITIYRRNDATANVVGFSIKGVRYILHEIGMPVRGSVRMADLLSGMILVWPDEATRMVAEIYAKEKLPAVVDGPNEAAAAT
jgi:hypothetical protein